MLPANQYDPDHLTHLTEYEPAGIVAFVQPEAGFVEYLIEFVVGLVSPTMTQILPLYAISFAFTVNPGSDGLILYVDSAFEFIKAVFGFATPTNIWFVLGSFGNMSFALPTIESGYSVVDDVFIPIDDA